jgi:hypothetical protein
MLLFPNYYFFVWGTRVFASNASQFSSLFFFGINHSCFHTRPKRIRCNKRNNKQSFSCYFTHPPPSRPLFRLLNNTKVFLSEIRKLLHQVAFHAILVASRIHYLPFMSCPQESHSFYCVKLPNFLNKDRQKSLTHRIVDWVYEFICNARKT